ncbi:MAG: GyrI-like domain-containing protein [Bacteroidia bacterium]|nr:GyrI-like domain-containing protein [Bacteroidia bacterium]
MYKSWLPKSGYELLDAPSFEKYLNNPNRTKPEKLKTQIYLPLK